MEHTRSIETLAFDKKWRRIETQNLLYNRTTAAEAFNRSLEVAGYPSYFWSTYQPIFWKYVSQ